jgi:hypothetical protein
MNYIDRGLFAEEPALFIGIGIILVWSYAWKGFALYRAGANHSPAWFVVLVIFNTLGILEILYLFVFGKKKSGQTPSAPAPVYQPPVA